MLPNTLLGPLPGLVGSRDPSNGRVPEGDDALPVLGKSIEVPRYGAQAVHTVGHLALHSSSTFAGVSHGVAAGAGERGVSWEMVIGSTSKGNCNPQHRWNGYDTDEITEMLTAGM